MMDPSRARIDSVGVDDEEGVSPASSAAPALVHAEHSSRGTLKYRGGWFLSSYHLVSAFMNGQLAVKHLEI